MLDISVAVGTACQIAYEYDNWTDEQVQDMYKTFDDCGEEPPCTEDELYCLTYKAGKYYNEDLSFDDALAKLQVWAEKNLKQEAYNGL